MLKGCKTTVRKLQSRAAWLMLSQPAGNFTGLSATEEMCVGIYWGFAIEMCNFLQEKAQLRPGGRWHLQSGSRLHLAMQVTRPPVLGFVCATAAVALGLPKAMEICAPMCCGVSLLQNTWPTPTNEATFILISGRSLPFSLLHSHRAKNGNG